MTGEVEASPATRLLRPRHRRRPRARPLVFLPLRLARPPGLGELVAHAPCPPEMSIASASRYSPARTARPAGSMPTPTPQRATTSTSRFTLATTSTNPRSPAPTPSPASPLRVASRLPAKSIHLDRLPPALCQLSRRPGPHRPAPAPPDDRRVGRSRDGQQQLARWRQRA